MKEYLPSNFVLCEVGIKILRHSLGGMLSLVKDMYNLLWRGRCEPCTAGDVAVSHSRGQHELSPALKALSQLSHDDSGGWICDLDRLQPKSNAGRRRLSLHRSGYLRNPDQQFMKARGPEFSL